MASKGTPVGFKQLLAAAGPGEANRNRKAGSTWWAVSYRTSINLYKCNVTGLGRS
jgi:hypothetical protein